MKAINPKLSVLACCLLLTPYVAAAQEEFSGTLSLGWDQMFSDRKDSGKEQEYRDLRSGVDGDVDLNLKNDGYYFSLDTQHLGYNDQRITMDGGKAGSFKIEYDHNQIPHRYVFDAKTLYTGLGTGEMTLAPGVQQAGQQAAGTSSQAAASFLESAETDAQSIDFKVQRDRDAATFTLSEFDPVNLLVEVKRDSRHGFRPMGASFGFGNAVEVADPRDFQTMEYKTNLEYASKMFNASVGYYASVFDNDIDSLTWDNPFRASDSTSAAAFAGITDGPSTGRIGLAPDNWYQSLSLNGTVKNLPLKTRLTSTLSWGWARQDDDLLPFTTNTAISPASGAPINASVLPTSSANAQADSALYNVTLTSQPLSFMDAKAHYRYTERKNETDKITFPLSVAFDASADDPITTYNLSTKKHNTGLDLGFDVVEDTKLTLGYNYEHVERTQREVNRNNDNVLSVALDRTLNEWISFNTSYSRSIRRISGQYDPSAPFGNEAGEIPQLPFLRRYDEASRNKDTLSLRTTVTPNEDLEVSGMVQYGRADYSRSDFGLLNDQQWVYELEGDYAVTKRTKLNAFYSFESHRSNEAARQWNPGGIGDPFNPAFADESTPSNWRAGLTDNVHTIGAGFEIAVIPKSLIFKTTYSLSLADGKVDFGSPVDSPTNDTNAFEPKDFNQVDDTVIQRINPQLVYTLRKDLDLIVGYLWEKYDAGDYNKDNFTTVAKTPNGNYNGALLMGTLPYEDYEINYGYARVLYKF